MTKPIYILNGPNLNRLGKREPEIYGKTTLAEIEAECKAEAKGEAIEFRQTNSEAVIDIDVYQGDIVVRVSHIRGPPLQPMLADHRRSALTGLQVLR